MKILNFGSLNIDNVYTVEEFVRPGETVTAKSHTVFAGGKGLNQSIAAARAGAEVIHGGAIGPDGGFLASLLEEAGAMPVICSGSTSPPVTLSLRSTPADRTAFSSGAAQTAG